MRGIRLHQNNEFLEAIDEWGYCPREGYKVASPASSFQAISINVTVPVRGIRLHQNNEFLEAIDEWGYCPREGYKVASPASSFQAISINVTVPVRGIRLHPVPAVKMQTMDLLLSP